LNREVVASRTCFLLGVPPGIWARDHFVLEEARFVVGFLGCFMVVT